MSNGHPYAMNGQAVYGGYEGAPQAGPSSASSSPPEEHDGRVPISALSGPPHLKKRTSSLQTPPRGKGRDLDPADGFLGDVARWTQDQSSLGQRTTSRMVGSGRWGSSPPPMAPRTFSPRPLAIGGKLTAASDPPPMPPGAGVHPFAAAAAGPGPLARAAGRPGITISPRKSSVPLQYSPNSALPPIPPMPFNLASSPLAGPGPSTLAAQDAHRHYRQSSLASYRSSNSRNSASPPSPSSPTQTIGSLPPSISPRTSSLTIPSRSGSIDGDAARLPSRQLLQSALDLAQRAVEMDRNNDTQGALDAYQEAVTRLRLVMQRVGVEPSKGAKGKSPVHGSAEDEGRTLRGIHDAYVQRIQLLMGYGKEPEAVTASPVAEAPVEAPAAEAPDSKSTSTLVPTKPPAPTSSDEPTPRPSLDQPREQMANLDISDSTAAPPPPIRSLGRPISTEVDPNELASRKSSGALLDVVASTPIAASLQQALDDVTVQTPDFPPPRPSSIQLASPTTSAESPVPDAISPTIPFTPPSDSAAAMETTPSSITSPSRIARLRSRAMGIDQEAGLPDEEVEVAGANVEMLNRTPQAPARTSEAGGSRRGSTEDKALPPIPHSTSSRSIRKPLPFDFGGKSNGLVSSSTAQGTISQRRLSRNLNSAHTTPEVDNGEFSPAVPFPSSTSTSSMDGALGGLLPRLRTKSQPAHDPFHRRDPSLSAPPVPPVPRKKASLTFPRGLRINVGKDHSLMPPASISSATPRSSRLSGMAGSLISPLPETQPSEVLHRPFHILRIIHRSMDESSPGVYLTGAIHISHFVWRPAEWSAKGGKGIQPKIMASDIKFRVIQQLLLHLTIIKSAGAPLLDGIREFRYDEPGAAPATPNMSAGQVAHIASEFEGALEGMEEEMEGSYKLLTKSGVGVGSWKGKAKKGGKEGGWSNSLKSKVGGMAKDKVMDSADKYVDVLENLCAAIQALDHHLLCVSGPCTPAYHALQPAQYHALEMRLTRCAEFVGAVVVPFVLDDLKQFFLRYLKGGVRYLED